MKKIFFHTLLFLTLFSGNFSSEISAHQIIPDDIMNIILENKDITDEEIDQIFLEKYGVTKSEYINTKEQSNESGIRESLKGDPEYEAYIKKQNEENKKNKVFKNKQNLTNLKENIYFPEISSVNIFERAQKQEVNHLLALRKQLKNPENSNFFSQTQNAIIAGILHIWGGIDHILFFLTLLLVMRPFKQTLIIVSTFTLAHSLTLLLVGSGALLVNSKIIEIIIAVSIVYSAIFAGIQILKPHKNTVHEDFKHTLFIVFIFGLFHGMGFAEVFKDFHFSFSEYWISLLIYNGGIEIGQIILLLVFFPIIYWLHKKNWGQKFLVLSSFIIATLAVVWVFERV